MTEPDPDDSAAPGEAAGEAWSHLQAAAIELIAAGRSFLDAADAAVRSDDPARVVRGLVDLGRDAATQARDAAGASGDGSASPPEDGDYVDIPLDD
ncbi:MAG: hypothetical protein AAGA99_10810 [Actinomycetota bacterium]